MYIAIYVSVILLVGAGMVASFVLYQKKQKQRVNCLKKQRSQMLEEISIETDKTKKKSKKTEKTAQTEPVEEVSVEPLIEQPPVEEKIEPVFEDYDFDGDKKDKKPSTKEVVDRLNQSLEEDDDEEIYVKNSDFAKKFAAYEKFLEEEDFDEEDDDGVNPFKNDDLTELEATAVANFDYDSLQGKTENEIKDMTKHLPRAAQEIILAEVMHRREDEED